MFEFCAMKILKSINYISACGILGYGFSAENMDFALQNGKWNFIGADAGSSDPGPYYLGSGTGFVKPAQTKRDLSYALTGALNSKLPLIIGSAGGSGAKPHLESFLEILREIAAEKSLHFKLAVIYADIDRNIVAEALKKNMIIPCENVHNLTAENISQATNLVGQMGTEPFIKALKSGADVIIAGRSCDTAIFAAYPIMHGYDPGLALHAAKIAECGALCAIPAGANDSVGVHLGEDHFIVEPLSLERICTPESVAAHSLYEQPQPQCFFEPEGKINMRNSVFTQHDNRSVKVSGSRLEPAAESTIKLEGARLAGYRSLTIAGMRDPLEIRNLDAIQQSVRENVAKNLKGILDESRYSLRFLRYGLDAVNPYIGNSSQNYPDEIGLLIDVIAASQAEADLVVSLARSTALHQSFPGRKTTAGNLAFPFSPSDFRGGAVYEFSVYHLMKVSGKEKEGLFKIKLMEV